MKNDAEWINSHLPLPVMPPRQKDVLDWKKIDKEMSIKVEKACQKIYQSIPLKRVSITEIIRKIGNKKWIEKRELKLPKTTQVINKKLETLEDFMIRKLRFAEEKFMEIKSVPTRKQLRRQATINNLTSVRDKKRWKDPLSSKMNLPRNIHLKGAFHREHFTAVL